MEINQLHISINNLTESWNTSRQTFEATATATIAMSAYMVIPAHVSPRAREQTTDSQQRKWGNRHVGTLLVKRSRVRLRADVQTHGRHHLSMLMTMPFIRGWVPLSYSLQMICFLHSSASRLSLTQHQLAMICINQIVEGGVAEADGRLRVGDIVRSTLDIEYTLTSTNF